MIFDVSLIISSRNRPRLLQDTVQSVLAGHRLPAEIILIDQSDQPNTAFSTRMSERGCIIRYFWPAGIGASRGRNLGVGHATNDILVFMDDDMIATPFWLGHLISTLLSSDKRIVVTGRVLQEEIADQDHFAPSTINDENPMVYTGRISKDVLYTANMGVNRFVFDKIGFFDENLGPGTLFPSAEDNDFCFRLLEAGFQIHYNPTAILYHRAWRSHQEYLPLKWRYGVGRGAYYAKHLHTGDHFMVKRLLRDMQTNLSTSLSLLPRDRRLALGHLATGIGILYGVVRWKLEK